MSTVTVFSAARMLAIEAASIVSGLVNGSGDLILTKQGGGTINAGHVVGATGAQGPVGVGPTGSVMLFGAAAAPSGWLLCDGASYLRTDYAALFTLIGTAYGSVDGTHFNVPNLKGRVPVGLDSSQTEFDTLGETGGEKTHVLTTAELSAHNHGVNETAHSHTVTNGTVPTTTHTHTLSEANAWAKITLVAQAGVNFFMRRVTATGYAATHADSLPSTPAGNTTANTSGAGLAGTTDGDGATQTVSVNTTSTGITTQNNGSGTAHNNLQPYLVMNYIIKT